MSKSASSTTSTSCALCGVVELRRYALRPGRRETLIELFDREFVETQEAVGMCVLGQFRDLDAPDSFVWMRGFCDMETRKDSLEAFYGGPVWKEHAHAANATMIDSDNVLLLRPVAGLEVDRARRAIPGSTTDPPGLLAVTIWWLAPDTAGRFPDFFRGMLEPALSAAGIRVLATYATEHSENTFPGLPVREDQEVFLYMSMFGDEIELAGKVSALERSALWRDAAGSLASLLARPAEFVRLSPTARSALHA